MRSIRPMACVSARVSPGGPLHLLTNVILLPQTGPAVPLRQPRLLSRIMDVRLCPVVLRALASSRAHASTLFCDLLVGCCRLALWLMHDLQAPLTAPQDRMRVCSLLKASITGYGIIGGKRAAFAPLHPTPGVTGSGPFTHRTMHISEDGRNCLLPTYLAVMVKSDGSHPDCARSSSRRRQKWHPRCTSSMYEGSQSGLHSAKNISRHNAITPLQARANLHIDTTEVISRHEKSFAATELLEVAVRECMLREFGTMEAASTPLCLDLNLRFWSRDSDAFQFLFNHRCRALT